MQKCPNCHTELSNLALFCHECGAILSFEEKTPDQPKAEALEQQILGQFFVALKKRVEEEWHSDKYQLYSERLYDSGFREIVHRRALELSEGFSDNASQQDVPVELEMQISVIFEELLDFFFIHYCKDINDVYLPEAILKYQQIDPAELNLFQMVFDYLNLDHEDEDYYTDFLQMPMKKLTNAGKFFLFPGKKEKILIIFDQSFFGSLKEGFALTEKAIYWKAYLQTARKVTFTELQKIQKEKEWITINGHFFNVNRSINLKMMKLLKKLMSLFALK